MITFKLNYKNIIRYNPLIAVNTLAVFCYLYYTNVKYGLIKDLGLMASLCMSATGVIIGLFLILDFFNGAWFKIAKHADRNSKIATAIYCLPFLLLTFHWVITTVRVNNIEKVDWELQGIITSITGSQDEYELEIWENYELYYTVSLIHKDKEKSILIDIIVDPHDGKAKVELQTKDKNYPEFINIYMERILEYLRSQTYRIEQKNRVGFMN